MKKRLYIDTETTGLDYRKNAIIEIAGIIEIDNEVVLSFSFDMKPDEEKVIEEAALEVNGVTKELLNGFRSSSSIYKEVIKILDKYIDKYDTRDKFYFYAYNAKFDADFVNQWFLDNNNNFLYSYVHWPWISVDVLAAIYAEGQRDKLGDFKLGTVAKALGIEVDDSKLHGGLYDVELCRSIYNRLEGEFNI